MSKGHTHPDPVARWENLSLANARGASRPGGLSYPVGRGTGPRQRPRARLCRSGSPDPDPFVIGRAQTTERGERKINNVSCSLQVL